MMKSYKICDLVVNMDLKYSMIRDRAEKYLIEKSDSPDIIIESDEDSISRIKEIAPHLSKAECEVIHTTSMFYRRLLSYDGFMLHSSAVCVDNKAYLFSANSGTGKSTHTTQWLSFSAIRHTLLMTTNPH